MKQLNIKHIEHLKKAIFCNLYHIILKNDVENDQEKLKNVLAELIINYNVDIPEKITYEERIKKDGIISCFITEEEACTIRNLDYVLSVESEKFARIEK